MNAILLSIKPKWAKLIYDGEKDIEWRKNIPSLRGHGGDICSIDATRAYLYETNPISAVTGYIEICSGHRYSNPRSIPEDFLAAGKVPLDQLEKYAAGKDLYGWEIDITYKFDFPKKLSDFRNWRGAILAKPPQSWCYLEDR